MFDLLSFKKHIIVKAILNGWSVTKAASIDFLHGLSHYVGTGVPINLKRTHLFSEIICKYALFQSPIE